MNIKEELGLRRNVNINRESMVSIVRTSSLLLRAAGRFFSKYIVTEVQFNILMILKDKNEGLSQQDLSERLVVTKSNVVGLVDRLEKSGLVKRKSDPSDRRTNRVVLTAEGKAILKKIEGDYSAAVDEIMNGLTKEEKAAIINATQKIRFFVKNNWE